MDLLLRRYIAAFTRETICFAKKHSRMIDKYILFLCYKNYMRPRFVKPHKSDPTANIHSPAIEIGLTKRMYNFSTFFGRANHNANILAAAEKLPRTWKLFLEDKTPFSREKKYCREKSAN